jgi:hypothetical protein
MHGVTARRQARDKLEVIPMTKAKAQTTTKAAKKEGATVKTASKQDQLIGLLRRPNGATIEELSKVTGWQPHSVRGAISGVLKKKLGLPVSSETSAKRGRVYRIDRASAKSAA